MDTQQYFVNNAVFGLSIQQRPLVLSPFVESSCRIWVPEQEPDKALKQIRNKPRQSILTTRCPTVELAQHNRRPTSESRRPLRWAGRTDRLATILAGVERELMTATARGNSRSVRRRHQGEGTGLSVEASKKRRHRVGRAGGDRLDR